MTTKLQVFQQACAYCQVPIESTFNSNTPSATAFNTFYDLERQAVLAMPLEFARSTTPLNEVTINQEEKYLWEHAFAQPDDMVESAAYVLHEQDSSLLLSQVRDYQSYRNNYYFYVYEKRGNLILTDVPAIDMTYTVDKPVEDFSPIAAKFLILNVAISMNGTLLGINNVATDLQRRAAILYVQLQRETVPSPPISMIDTDGDTYWPTTLERYF